MTSSMGLRRYPRRYCLGLIEAAVNALLVGIRVGCIRGVIASASLKLLSKLSMMSIIFLYPRRYCLGLIEASRAIA